MKREPEELVAPEELEGPIDPWARDFTPERVIRILEPLARDARSERLRQVTHARIGSVTVVMDAPHDPHNASAVLRSCDALGIPRVHVVPRDEEFAAAKTVAKGAQRWVEVVVHPDPESALGALRGEGFRVVATHPNGRLQPEDLASVPRLALVLGNEHDGIREALERGADDSVRVPMRGYVESLNVSVAAAILLHAATRGRAGDLPEAERARLYARALVRSVPRSLEVLEASRSR